MLGWFGTGNSRRGRVQPLPQRTLRYLAAALVDDNPLDVMFCPSLQWGCRYLRVDRRRLVDHVWDYKAMADLRYRGADQAKLAAIEGLVLRDRYLRFAVLDESFLFAADLTGADLRKATLVEARLLKAQLQHAQLQGARLNVAYLQGANLILALLQDAELSGAQLQGANLFGAQMLRVNLGGAQLQGAYLWCQYGGRFPRGSTAASRRPEYRPACPVRIWPSRSCPARIWLSRSCKVLG
jgi:Pentapeptide repeats (8 copies)